MSLLAQSSKAWLFYLKHQRGERGQLGHNVTRDICVYLVDCLLLTQVTPTFLRFFNTLAWGPQVLLSTPILVGDTSSWVLLKDGRLFCSGGNSQTGFFSTVLSVAYLLGRDGAVDSLPNMLTARCSHGVIQVSQLYIFGGSKP